MAEAARRALISMVRQTKRLSHPNEVPLTCANCGEPCWVTLDLIEHAEFMLERGRRVYFICIDCLMEAQTNRDDA